MIRAFILYYLNMKPTHGYEIQKFLQVSGADQWTKIQSGSIYYALTKLEKEKHITELREERTGSRVRKIYGITESGKEELRLAMAEELNKPISPVGSIKFFTDPMLGTLSKEEVIRIVNGHIAMLKEQKEFWERWYQVKGDPNSSDLTRISFQMSIQSLDSQISWHQELLEHLEDYIQASKNTEYFIKTLDFNKLEETEQSEEDMKLQYVKKLKDEILKDPQNAVVNLDRIIEELQRQKDQKQL